MYDYKSDSKQLSAENEVGTFDGLGNVSSDFKLKKGGLPQWAVNWARNKFNMDAKNVKFYITDEPKTNGPVALAGGNGIFVDPSHKNDEEVIKHELTHIYQQAIGSVQKNNANDPELEREAIEVSNGKNPDVSKNSRLGKDFVIPNENTGVVQGFSGSTLKTVVEDEIVVRPSEGTLLTSSDTSQYQDCKNIKIDESVTKIDDKAFIGFENLITIDMPNVTEIGQGAFYRCTNLKEISMPNISEIGSSAFEYCENLIKIDTSNVTIIGESTFNECIGLKEINMPNVKEICNDAFWGCEGLMKIDIPNITRTEKNTFNVCTNLKEINIQNVKEIGELTFSGLVNLSKVNMLNVNEIGKGAFMNCKSLRSAEMPHVTKIDEAAFWVCTSLSSVNMLNVKEIGISAFVNCQSLDSVDVSGVTEISMKTFYRCTNLSKVNMLNVSKIGKEAFMSCKSLSSAEMPSVKEIGERAFGDCTNLKKVALLYCCNYPKTAFPDECQVEYKDIPDISDISRLKLIQLYENGIIKPGKFLKDINIGTVNFASEENYYLLLDALYSKSVKLADVISRFSIKQDDLLTRDKYGFDIYDAYIKNWISEDEIKRLMPNINLFSKMNTDKYYLDHGVGLGSKFKAQLSNFEKFEKTPENIIPEFAANYRFKSPMLNAMRSGIYKYSNNFMMHSRTLTDLMPYMRNTGEGDIKLYRGIKDYETIDYMANMSIGSFEKDPQCIVGKEIFDRSFISTTISSEAAEGYSGMRKGNKTAVFLEIKVPNGVKLNMMPIANMNDEVVCNRFQKLKVNKVIIKSAIRIIRCEAIEDKSDTCKTEKDIYESNKFKEYQEEFEIDLGKYLYKSDEAYKAVHEGIRLIMEKNPKKSLREIFYSNENFLLNEKYNKGKFSGNITEFNNEDLTDDKLKYLLKYQKPTDEDLQSPDTTVAGNLREKLAAFQFAVDDGTLDRADVSNQGPSEFEPHIGRRERTDGEKFRRDFDYQDKELQLFRSARERKYQGNFRNGGKSPITYGGMLFQPQYNGKDIDSFYGKRLVAGTSGTAMRLLSKYRKLNGNKTDLLNFRLALIACMLPEKNHSLYEILQASHEVGVKGYENLSTADTMDKTIDPLGEKRVKEEVCKGKGFPFERTLKEKKEGKA